MNNIQLPMDFYSENWYYGNKNPSMVHTQHSQIVNFYRQYLLQKAMSVYKWTLPKEWPENMFKYWLYCNGYLGILYTPEYGTIYQLCSFIGYNIFYLPTHIIVNNQQLQNVTRKIDSDCVVIKIQPNYRPVIDIINDYAEELALCRISIDVNLINTRVAHVFSVDNKKEAEKMKKLYDEVSSGNPAVFYKEQHTGDRKWDYFSQNIKQNYIVADLLSDMRKIENRFNTEFGIPNSNLEKKERMIVDEVNENNAETRSRAKMWLEDMQAQCAKARKMFGINLDVNWAEGMAENENYSLGNVEL